MFEKEFSVGGGAKCRRFLAGGDIGRKALVQITDQHQDWNIVAVTPATWLLTQCARLPASAVPTMEIAPKLDPFAVRVDSPSWEKPVAEVLGMMAQ